MPCPSALMVLLCLLTAEWLLLYSPTVHKTASKNFRSPILRHELYINNYIRAFYVTNFTSPTLRHQLYKNNYIREYCNQTVHQKSQAKILGNKFYFTNSTQKTKSDNFTSPTLHQQLNPRILHQQLYSVEKESPSADETINISLGKVYDWLIASTAKVKNIGITKYILCSQSNKTRFATITKVILYFVYKFETTPKF